MEGEARGEAAPADRGPEEVRAAVDGHRDARLLAAGPEGLEPRIAEPEAEDGLGAHHHRAEAVVDDPVELRQGHRGIVAAHDADGVEPGRVRCAVVPHPAVVGPGEARRDGGRERLVVDEEGRVRGEQVRLGDARRVHGRELARAVRRLLDLLRVLPALPARLELELEPPVGEERQAVDGQLRQERHGGPRPELPDARGHRDGRVRLPHARRVLPELGLEVLEPHPGRLGDVAIRVDGSTVHERSRRSASPRRSRHGLGSMLSSGSTSAQPQVKGYPGPSVL